MLDTLRGIVIDGLACSEASDLMRIFLLLRKGVSIMTLDAL